MQENLEFINLTTTYLESCSETILGENCLFKAHISGHFLKDGIGWGSLIAVVKLTENGAIEVEMHHPELQKNNEVETEIINCKKKLLKLYSDMQKNPKEIWIGDKCYKKNKKLKKQIQALLGNQTAFHEKLDIIGEVFDNVLQLEDIVDRETWEFLDLPVPEAIAENIVGDYLVHRIFLD